MRCLSDLEEWLSVGSRGIQGQGLSLSSLNLRMFQDLYLQRASASIHSHMSCDGYKLPGQCQAKSGAFKEC